MNNLFISIFLTLEYSSREDCKWFEVTEREIFTNVTQQSHADIIQFNGKLIIYDPTKVNYRELKIE